VPLIVTEGGVLPVVPPESPWVMFVTDPVKPVAGVMVAVQNPLEPLNRFKGFGVTDNVKGLASTQF
jgi:hypothetical protein